MAGFKRRIFYIGGFDPRGVRFYHQMAHEQIGRYAARTGEQVTVSSRHAVSPIQTDWTVANATLGVETRYSFLRWEDLVRRAWIVNPVTLARRAAGTYRDHLRFLDFAVGRTLSHGPLVTLFYPPLLSVVLPLLIALPIVLLGLVWAPWWLALAIGLGIGIAAAVPILRSMHAPWLLRFFVFNGDVARDRGLAALDQRIADFADLIAGALDDPVDETLIVTHSNGSILAVPLMVRLLEARGGTLPANAALVTLGHCIPLVALRRDATRMRDQLRVLARHRFRWIDIGSPPDGAAYYGVNPMRLIVDEALPDMTLLSPRFHLFYDADTYHKGWRNKYEVHFDYLRVGDRVSPLDHPSVVASNRPIGDAVAAFRKIP